MLDRVALAQEEEAAEAEAWLITEVQAARV
jgi:hypothetical protein